MKKNNNLSKRLHVSFFLCFLFMFSLNTINAQCISGLTYDYEEISRTSIPLQCTYSIDICVFVNDMTLTDLSFSISTGSRTSSAIVVAPFSVGQQVCQNLEIIIANCDEGAFVNIDVEASNPLCTIENYDGGLDLGPLAVEFAHLQGYQSKNEIMIEWITESESDNDYFEIEHSKDGRVFTTVEKIDGSGNSSGATAYNYMHRFPNNGMNYYRIKMVEFDGSIAHSNMISVKLESKGIVNIFPTNVDSELNVKIFNSITQNIPVHIYNSIGNRIASYSIEAGDNSLQIPTSNLTSGVYYVKIKLQGEGVITKTFFKKTL